MLVVVLKPVVQRDDRASVRERRARAQAVDRVGQREQMVPVLHEVLDLCGKGSGADARADRRIADAVVVQDAHAARRSDQPPEPVQGESGGSEESRGRPGPQSAIRERIRRHCRRGARLSPC